MKARLVDRPGHGRGGVLSLSSSFGDLAELWLADLESRRHRPDCWPRRLAQDAELRARGAVHPDLGQPRQPATARQPRRRPDMVRARAVAAGLDGTRVTAHSFRAGHANTAALDGVPLNRIAAQTRHKDLGVLANRCIQSLEVSGATTSSRTSACDRPWPTACCDQTGRDQ